MEEFIRDADLLVYDCQYTLAEYRQSRKGWGHSSMEHAIDVALQNKVKRLALFHHDIQRTDDQLDALSEQLNLASLVLLFFGVSIFGHPCISSTWQASMGWRHSSRGREWKSFFRAIHCYHCVFVRYRLPGTDVRIIGKKYQLQVVIHTLIDRIEWLYATPWFYYLFMNTPNI